MNTCRFCKKSDDAGRLVKYGPRHYAHARCGLDAQGVAFLDNLTDWQVSTFPYLVAKEYGLGERVEAAYARQEQQRKAQPSSANPSTTQEQP